MSDEGLRRALSGEDHIYYCQTLLREARHAIVQASIYLANDDPVSAQKAIKDAHRVLAATPRAPALDVERLGHALMANDDSGSGLTPYYWHLQAIAIAREYAALAPERQDG
jgi:hypothetical protein